MMIEVLSTADGVVSIRLSGKVEKQEWEQVTEAVSTALSQRHQVSLYADLTELAGMSAGAVFEDMQFSLKNFRNFDQFSRVALVTDSTLIEKAVEAGTKALSALDVRAFSQDQENEARRWVEP